MLVCPANYSRFREYLGDSFRQSSHDLLTDYVEIKFYDKTFGLRTAVNGDYIEKFAENDFFVVKEYPVTQYYAQKVEAVQVKVKNLSQIMALLDKQKLQYSFHYSSASEALMLDIRNQKGNLVISTNKPIWLVLDNDTLIFVTDEDFQERYKAL